jgi:pyrroloquinoline quinone biosynthesis protein B
MKIKILGSAAGGGFPQWNCACRNCSGLREGKVHARPRTQTQVAFSPDNQVWFLVGASPDLRSQILLSPELTPRPENHGRSPIGGLFLPSAEVDAVMGLLHLREFQSFLIFATAVVRDILKSENRIFRVLDRADPAVEWRVLSSKSRLGCHLSDDQCNSPSFVCDTIPLGGSFPDYVSDEFRRSASTDEATVGFLFEQSGKRVLIMSSLSGRETGWRRAASSADLVLLDGTFWSDDELRRTGRSTKSAREIGHLPLAGADGLLAQFPKVAPGRRILLHINNTNPILDEDSPERREVLDAGFEVAYDGLEICL